MDKKAKLSFANLYSTYGVFFILVIEFLIFSLASKSFLTLGNILSVGRQMSFTGIAAIGMTLVMLTGGIDISVGSMLAMAGVLCAKLSADVGLPLWIAVVITLLIGALFGLINGAAVTRLHIPALIATLATQTILKGIAYLLTNAVPVKNLSATYKFLGQGYIFGVIPVPLIITRCTCWRGGIWTRRIWAAVSTCPAATRRRPASPASTPSGPSPAPMCSAACSRPLPVC